MVPRTTANKVIKVLNAFRTAYRKTKHAFACQRVTMARDIVPRYGVFTTHGAFFPPRPWDNSTRRPPFTRIPIGEQQTRPPIPEHQDMSHEETGHHVREEFVREDGGTS